MTLMTRRSFAATSALALAAPASAWAQSAASQADTIISNEEIARILADRVDVRKKGVGMVAGIIASGKRRIVGYGKTRTEGGPAPDGDTLYATASIAKVFTALLLADMVVRGYVQLDDPAQKYLPSNVTLRTNGRPMTLADIATHTSGLPFNPNNGRSLNAMTENEFTDFLSSFEPQRAPGASWQYSNVGYTLLAYILARRADRNFAELIESRITAPLGMESTFVGALPPAAAPRLAQAYDTDLKPYGEETVSDIGLLSRLYSTANDLLTFVSKADGTQPTKLGRAFALLPRTRRPAPSVGEQALGWEVITPRGGTSFLSKDGLGRGYGASMVFDAAAARGAVVLSNVDVVPSDIARHLLRPSIPLAKHFVVTAMNPSEFPRFVGDYELAPGRIGKVEADTSRLWLNIPGLTKLPLTPIGASAFASLELGIEVSFQVDDQRRATSLLIKRPDGSETNAKRIG